MSAATMTCTPQAALTAVRAHKSTILLDLDETLYLRNSTEDFINLARPALLGLLLLRLLDVVKPWRWTGGEATRDIWRVGVIRRLLPWTDRAWNKQVASLAAQHGNRPLMNALSACPGPIIVLTAGFTPIVEPLIRALQIKPSRVMAADPNSWDDRLHGKLPRALTALGQTTVAESLVLTDSAEDLPLLEACATPVLTRWPDAIFRSALSRVYLPGQYIAQVKRPGERYILRGVVQEDLAFWLLATTALAASPLLHIAGLLLLSLSFWTLYEQGYVDNDHCAELYEEQPKLNAAYYAAPVATPPLLPWLWAAISGTAAVTLLRWPHPQPGDYVAWALLLGVTHLWFRAYNRSSKPSRVWMYPGLQLARSVAPLVVVAASPIGAAALGAHTFARSVPYFGYRRGSYIWPSTPIHLVRLVCFCVLALMLGVIYGVNTWATSSAIGLLAWNVFRARQEIQEFLLSMHRHAQRSDT